MIKGNRFKIPVGNRCAVYDTIGLRTYGIADRAQAVNLCDMLNTLSELPLKYEKDMARLNSKVLELTRLLREEGVEI